MIVIDPPLPGFDDFVAANSLAWPRSRRANSGTILVELTHNNATMLCTNLIVANYLARFTGCDVIGFTAPTYTRYPVAVEQVRRLAESYGVREVVNVYDDQLPRRRLWSMWPFRPSARHRNSVNWDRLKRRLSSLEGAALRNAVLELHVKDVWIGDLVYDSYLYLSARPTAERFDAHLTETLERCQHLFSSLEDIFRREAVQAIVVSHTVYVEYGLPMRLALKHGGAAYGKWGLNPFVMRQYNSLSEAPVFPGSDIGPLLAHYQSLLGDQLPTLATAFYPPSPSRVASFESFRYGYGEGKREAKAETLRQQLRLDPNKKTCCLMSHMFVDSPHCYPALLFDDYYQWLLETLAFAARNPQVNWLVRQHPYEIMVGHNENFRSAVAPYVDRGSVAVVPNEITTSSLFSCVDAITTCIGSAGIEFASVGIPCIYAGKPYYSDCPFIIRPPTREAYFAALAKVTELPRLTPEDQILAKKTAYVALKCLPVRCDMFPETFDLAAREPTEADFRGWWGEASQRVSTISPEQDRLYCSLSRLYAGETPTLLNYELERTVGL